MHARRTSSLGWMSGNGTSRPLPGCKVVTRSDCRCYVQWLSSQVWHCLVISDCIRLNVCKLTIKVFHSTREPQALIPPVASQGTSVFFYTYPLIESPVFVLAIYVVWPREPVNLCTTKVASSPDFLLFLAARNKLESLGTSILQRHEFMWYIICVCTVSSQVYIVYLYTTIVAQHGMVYCETVSNRGNNLLYSPSMHSPGGWPCTCSYYEDFVCARLFHCTYVVPRILNPRKFSAYMWQDLQ